MWYAIHGNVGLNTWLSSDLRQAVFLITNVEVVHQDDLNLIITRRLVLFLVKLKLATNKLGVYLFPKRYYICVQIKCPQYSRSIQNISYQSYIRWSGAYDIHVFWCDTMAAIIVYQHRSENIALRHTLLFTLMVVLYTNVWYIGARGSVNLFATPGRKCLYQHNHMPCIIRVS